MRVPFPTMDETADNRGAAGRAAGRQHLDVEVLSTLIDGRLAREDRDAAAAHLAGCADCRRELAEMRATVDLLRGLPQYAPGRSFQLGRAVAPAEGLGWFARLLPALPTLRAATVAVALLLMAVTAGDIVSNRTGDDADRPRTEQRTLAAPTAADQDAQTRAAAGTESTAATSDEVAAPPAPADSDQDAFAADGPAESEQASAAFDEAAPPPAAEAAPEAVGAADDAGADAAPEAALAIEAAAPAATGGDGAGAQAPAANALAESADPAAATAIGPSTGATRSRSVERATAAPPTVSLATPTPLPPPGDAPGAGQPAPGTAAEDDARTRPSGWRLAEVGLGLLLLWLLVSLVGLQRLRRRSGAPG